MSAAGQPMDLLLSNGTIVTMNGAREILDRADVLVSGGKIAKIGRRLGSSPAGRRVVDCSGKVLIPGLIHGHLHACQTLFRNQADGLELLEWLRERIWPLEAAHDSVSMRISADLTFAELIRSGSTAALDMGTVHHTDAIFESAQDCGFRLTSGKAMMDIGEGLPVALCESRQESVAQSIRLLKRWHGAQEGRLRYAFAPRFVLSCSEELLLEVARIARAHRARIHTHASENRGELEEVRRRAGMGNIEYLHSLGLTGSDVTLAHCVWVDRSERETLGRTQTCVCHCPSSNFKLGSGIAPVPELLSQRVPLSLGADGAACNNNLDLFTEMRLAAIIHNVQGGARVLTSLQILEMATLGGARALGMEGEVGCIDEGRRADIAVLDLVRAHAVPGSPDVVSQIVYSARAEDVQHVLIEGKMVMRDRRLLTLDEPEVLARAAVQSRQRMRKAFPRMGLV